MLKDEDFNSYLLKDKEKKFIYSKVGVTMEVSNTGGILVLLDTSSATI